MRKKLTVGLLISIAVIALVLAATSLTGNRTDGPSDDLDNTRETRTQAKLLIAAEEFVPFEYEEDGVVKGVNVEVTNLIFDKLEIPYEVQIIPWARTWKMLETGEADATFSTSYEEFRDEHLYYTEDQRQFKKTGEVPEDRLWVNEFVFFTRKIHRDSLKFDSYAQVKNDGYKIGVIKDNSYVDSFWEANLDTRPYPSARDAFQALLDGEVDVYIVDKITGQATIEQMGVDNEISFIPSIVDSKPMLMPFSKSSNYPDLENIMNDYYKELRALRASGKYQEIYDKYI